MSEMIALYISQPDQLTDTTHVWKFKYTQLLKKSDIKGGRKEQKEELKGTGDTGDRAKQLSHFQYYVNTPRSGSQNQKPMAFHPLRIILCLH